MLRGVGDRGRRHATPSVVLAAAAVVVLVGLALTSGAGGAADFARPRLTVLSGGPAAQDVFDGLMDQPQEQAPPVESSDTPWVLVLLLVVGTLLAVVVVRTLRPPAADGAPAPAGRSAPAVPGDAGPEALLALRRAAAQGVHRLGGTQVGRTRDAVVACWLDLERAAAASGSPRDPAQTPTEFTAALLARHAADPRAGDELLRLYHRARFGSAPLPGDAAGRAADALRRIAGSLPAGPRG
jgi:hypothetical protein